MTPPRTHRHGRAQSQNTLRAIDHAKPFIERLEELYGLATDWSPGYGGGAQDVKVSGGGQDGSPPPPGTWQPRPVDQLDDDLRAVVTSLDRFVRHAIDLLHRSTDTGRRTTTALCAGCQRTVANTSGDRLRAGLCNACYHEVRALAADHPHLERGDVLLMWARSRGVIEHTA